MTYDETLRLRILSLCKEKRFSVHKLSKLSGVPHSTLINFLCGNTKNPKIETVLRLAQGFDMTAEEFFGFCEMRKHFFDEG